MSSVRNCGLSTFRGVPSLAPWYAASAAMVMKPCPLGVKPCYLFLYASVGMGNDDGGVLPAGVIPGGRVNVGGNPEAVQGVVNGMDIDFPGDVFRDGSPVHKTEGIGRSGLGHAWQGQEGQNGKEGSFQCLRRGRSPFPRKRRVCFHFFLTFSGRLFVF